MFVLAPGLNIPRPVIRTILDAFLTSFIHTTIIRVIFYQFIIQFLQCFLSLVCLRTKSLITGCRAISYFNFYCNLTDKISFTISYLNINCTVLLIEAYFVNLERDYVMGPSLIKMYNRKFADGFCQVTPPPSSTSLKHILNK